MILRIAKLLRKIILTALVFILLLMNACSLIISEELDADSSGILNAKVIRLNAGAMSSYSGSVFIMPLYFPPIWPLNAIIGCQALRYESDPNIDVEWQGATLKIIHDPLEPDAMLRKSCYGRKVILEKRRK